MMISEHRAFLNAISDRPEDDLPRLVYADYLDETGDFDRAEFIRVQIELANLPENDSRWSGLDARQSELHKERLDWRLPIRGIQRFRRGFVEAIAVTADWLIDAPEPVLLLAPIRELRVINADNSVSALAEVEGLNRIVTLDLRNNNFGKTERLTRFLDAAPLDAMTRLLLQNNRLWSDGVETLVGHPHAAQLRTLDLSGNPIGDGGAAHLAGATSLWNLRELILRSDGLDWRDRIAGEGAQSFGHSQTLGELRTLDLAGHLIGDCGLAALAHAAGLQNLERVDASFNYLAHGDPSGFQEFFRANLRPAMRVWNLAGSFVGLNAAQGFAVWDQLETLRELNLERCEWEPGGREWLSESPWASKIRIGNPASGELV